jgi:hypothetical protein
MMPFDTPAFPPETEVTVPLPVFYPPVVALAPGVGGRIVYCSKLRVVEPAQESELFTVSLFPLE